MATTTNGDHLRQTMLNGIRDASRNGTAAFNPDDVLSHTLQTIGTPADATIRAAILCYFNDLLRTGAVGLGDVESIDPKFRVRSGPNLLWPHGLCHVTPEGQEVLKQASRDPSNPPGYLAYLDQFTPLDPVTRSYVEEALNTYRACCYKATAVLIGAAVENLVLILRDELRRRLEARGLKPSKGLTAWQAKTALEAVAKQILPDLAGEAKKTGDDQLRQLSEEAAAMLQPAAAEFRKTRNDAGHPASLTPVNAHGVHASLLMFPSTAKLLQRLTRWVTDYYR
jgi:hypothetical protein